jgi:ATP-dependent Clp protease ATP-binding subunit ClpC
LNFDPTNPDRITDPAKRVLVKAEALAIGRGSSQITPEDLLLALARCDRHVGRVVLEGFSIELDKLQDELAVLAPQGQAGECPPTAVAFSLETLRALEYAKQEAAALDHGYIGTEHLVLGLLRDGTSKAGQFLRERSASSEGARVILHWVLHGDEGS